MPQVMEPDTGEVAILNPFRERAPILVKDRHTWIYTPDQIKVTRKLRDDPLARLHSRFQISDAQFEAGRAWQRLYEASHVSAVGSSGDLKEPVDGTPPQREPITDRQVKAGKRIRELDIALGKVGSIYVRDILGDGLTIAQMSERHGIIANKRELERLGARFRECLSTLAREFGFAA